MKKIFILLASAGLLLCLPSCEKWLTATSSSQISDTQLFSSRAGFQEALSGIYLCLAQPECYGRDYTWFISDLAAYPYSAQHENIYSGIQNHNYTTAVTFPAITSMWLSGYHAIANINKMLLEIDARRDVVTDETEYRLMKGELLALRAWVHFDILRMWGLENWSGDNAGKMTVPYVTTYEKEPTVQRSYAETAALLMADIDAAVDLLSVDPIRGTKPENFDAVVNTNGFWDNRTSHLNWYAAKGLKARVLLWQDRFEEAAAIARAVIDEVLEKEIVHWVDPIAQLGMVTNEQRDWTFSCEHLFTLEVPDLYSTVQTYFFSDMSKSGLRIDPATVTLFFDTAVGFVVQDGKIVSDIRLDSDIRGPAMMLRFSGSGYIPYKFYASSSSVYRNRMPMLRLSELYLIAAEEAMQRDDVQGFLDMVNELNSHRGIDDVITPDNINRIYVDGEYVPAPDMSDLLTLEYAIELIGEGQFLPYLKRRARWDRGGAVYLSSGLIFATPNKLLFPYPNAETAYGHIQEL